MALSATGLLRNTHLTLAIFCYPHLIIIMVFNFFYICFIGTVCDFRLSYGRVLNRKSKIIAVNRNKSQLFKVKIFETMNACMNVRSIVDLQDEDYM